MNSQPVLVCESDAKTSQALQKEFAEEKSWEFASNGRDAQLKIYKQRYSVVFLDIDLESHSGVEVLRYIKTSQPQLRVVLVSGSKTRLSELGFDAKELSRLGITSTLIKPVSSKMIKAKLEELNNSVSWKNVQETASVGEKKESALPDSKFTRIRVEEFFSGEIAVFDIYIRLGKDKYLKLFNRGEPYDNARVKEYATEKQVEWFYFLTSDRAAFINYLNEISHRVMTSPNFSARQKLDLNRNIADQYLSEVQTRGIRPEIMEEGKKLCENMLTMARDDKSLAKLLRDFEAVDPQAFSESFLTAFFSSMIVAKLPWGSKHTVEKVVMGALLHDLGRLKLPPTLREKRADQMTEKELEIWKTHPRLGVEMLDTSPDVPEAIKQIVYQHHEFVNGQGFPSGLTGLKIYPLAKVVGFANGFAEFIRTEGLPPLEGLKIFLRKPGILEQYDPVIIKAFLTCFTDKEKQKKGRIA